MRIQTQYWAKPMPIRDMDWSAWDSDTYDCEWEGEETGYVGSPMGHGATEDEAIADLKEQLEMDR